MKNWKENYDYNFLFNKNKFHETFNNNLNMKNWKENYDYNFLFNKNKFHETFNNNFSFNMKNWQNQNNKPKP
jgi:hypothetical protein